MSSRLLIIIFAFVSSWIILYRDVPTNYVINFDKSGYYLYLPAAFIYHDLSDYTFFKDKAKEYNITGGDHLYGLYDQPTGKKLNKYAIGVSVAQLPFFLAAHLKAHTDRRYPEDGYSYPYLLGIIISNVIASIVGLFILRKFLLRYFPEKVVLITLFAIAFGTNLYYYTAFDHGMSHVYSFLFFAWLLFCTERWYATSKTKYILLLGFILGMITIIRPVNIMAGIIPLLWGVASIDAFKNRLLFFKSQALKIAGAAAIFLMVAFIQMAYWKYTTGHWIFYSYSGEGFDFLRPHIWDGLLSYRKGWFIYTPIAFVGFIGFFLLRKRYKELIPALLIFFVLIIYVVFSWTTWYYGGSFGCRPLIETLPVLAIPLAAFFNYVLALKQVFVKELIAILILFFVGLNLLQSYQYSYGIIHHERMSEKYYWKIFGQPNAEYWKYEKYLL